MSDCCFLRNGANWWLISVYRGGVARLGTGVLSYVIKELQIRTATYGTDEVITIEPLLAGIDYYHMFIR